MDITIMNLNLVKYDAIGNHILNLAKALSKKHNVSLMIQDPPKQISSICRYKFINEENIISAKRNSKFKHIFKKLDFKIFRSANKYDRYNLGDIVWANYPVFYSYLDIFRNRDKRTRGIFDYHGVTPPDLWDDDILRPILEEAVEKVNYVKYADLAIAHSNFTMKELEKIYSGIQIKKLPYAIDLDRFCIGNGNSIRKKLGIYNRKMLLYVGRMAGNKRVDIIIRSMIEIKKTIPDIVFVCVGNTEFPHNREYKNLMELSKKIGVINNVIFTGSVPDEELPEYFRAADVYVTSSLHEGFCIPILEAMACGKPTIASNCTALPETQGDGGCVFAPGNHIDMAKIVIEILENNYLYKNLSSNGINRAKQFSYNNFEKAIYKLIESK